MATQPVLHLVVGSNGAGKSTLYAHVIEPVTRLEFVNADVIAAERWPGEEAERSYEAARIAERLRLERIAQGRSFVAETVFSHPSKLELIDAARAAGYRITLHVVVVPVELAVARVVSRVAAGGHHVPERKVRERYERLWALVATAIGMVDDAIVYDNSRARTPFVRVARFEHGRLVGSAAWPAWAPPALVELT